jgi:quercetin dioxygenase-like cupin family protein
MPVHDKRGIHLAPGEGEPVRNPVGEHLTFKVRGEQSNGTLHAFESAPAPGEGPPLHVHADMDEVWYVLEGRFRFKLDSEVEDAPPGAFVFIPRGVPHTWQNVGDAPGRFLAIVTPAGLEQFFDRIAEVADDMPRLDAFRTIGRETGMDIVGPPLAASPPL